TGTLLDGIAGEEKPHAINALASALNLDMTRYWTPTRASYFDHVSKARIAEVVASAVSPKIAADLGKMKKAVAAAAAELRLAKSAWLPEIFTDRDAPVARSYGTAEDPGDDEESVTGDEVQEGDDAQGDDHGDNRDPDRINGTESGESTAPPHRWTARPGHRSPPRQTATVRYPRGRSRLPQPLQPLRPPQPQRCLTTRQ
ncbi:hypothetical protein PQQ96_11875, partial [Paraburkholderia sediminicola]